jgi:hypothetical protein
MAEDIVTLLMKTAVLSGECVEKLEILRKKIRIISPSYCNPKSVGTSNLVLIFLCVFASVIAHIWFLKWNMRSSALLGRFGASPINCLKELRYKP